MTDQVIAVLAGAAGGILLTALVWWLSSAARSAASRRLRKRIEGIMSAVADRINDADSLSVMYRRGKLGREAYLDSLEEKIESINCLYKPHLHRLDVYFVKYVEKIIEGYSGIIDNDTDDVVRLDPEPAPPVAEDPIVDAMITKSAEPDQSFTAASLELDAAPPPVPPVPEPILPAAQPLVMPQLVQTEDIAVFERKTSAYPQDFESETIIINRPAPVQQSAPRAAVVEPEKKDLGITGDDVMDKLDDLFGVRK